MPRKTIKIIKEDSIEKDEEVESPKEPLEEISLEEPKPVKVKKERTPKQIEAFNKALEKRKQNALEKKALKETAVDIPKEVDVEMTELPKEVKKRGRPSLSPEKIEEKATLKELALQKQLEKLQKNVDQSAKKEAKKMVLEKIKSKMDTEDVSEIDTDDEEEIAKIVKKQKKPIVIVNKIDNGKASKKQPTMMASQPTAIFV
jgi:hypothetical protein